MVPRKAVRLGQNSPEYNHVVTKVQEAGEGRELSRSGYGSNSAARQPAWHSADTFTDNIGF